MQIPKGLVIANSKGGSGKTSLASNLAAAAARSGWKTLAIDLDIQGNLGDDLGYLKKREARGDGESGSAYTDQGAAIRASLLGAETVEPPLQGVRENLDVYPGGYELRAAEAAFSAPVARGEQLEELGVRFSEVASRYDLVVFDTPPAGNSALTTMALTAARGLVIPVRHDNSSLRGLEGMARLYAEVTRSANPGLELLGVVQFEMGVSETRLRAELETMLRGLLPPEVEVFTPPIRHSNVAAMQMRQRGLTVFEYEEEAEDWTAQLFQRLREKSLAEAGKPPSKSATGLADDYMAVIRQILVSFGSQTAQSRQSASTGGEARAS